ncbi:hypothetical protein GOB91_29325 [Sinorhizobium meliloti]|nr:hypothetical protein [Sinorhizobium meliloti]MDW9732656.1 hypothetical protein [Sinorhizobium meliloti]
MLAERQRAWQPIETAPKDGTTILAFCQDGEGDDAEPMRQAVLKWDGNAGDSGLWVGYYRGLRYHGDPTHWQPLPPKPAAVSEGGEK